MRRLLLPIFAVIASFTTFSQSAQACNSTEDKVASPIAIKLDSKGLRKASNQVKIGPNIYKLNAEIIHNKMPSIGSPNRTPSYANVSLVPVKGQLSRGLSFDRLFIVNKNDNLISTTCDPVERSRQKISTVFRGLPSLPPAVDVVLQFRSRSGVHFVRANNVKVLSVY
jgi:hypothetical protein